MSLQRQAPSRSSFQRNAHINPLPSPSSSLQTHSFGSYGGIPLHGAYPAKFSLSFLAIASNAYDCMSAVHIVVGFVVGGRRRHRSTHSRVSVDSSSSSIHYDAIGCACVGSDRWCILACWFNTFRSSCRPNILKVLLWIPDRTVHVCATLALRSTSIHVNENETLYDNNRA